MNSASFISSLSMMIMMFFAPLSGFLSDKIRLPESILHLANHPCLRGLTASYLFRSQHAHPDRDDPMGAIGGAVPTAVFSAAPGDHAKTRVGRVGFGRYQPGSEHGHVHRPHLVWRSG